MINIANKIMKIFATLGVWLITSFLNSCETTEQFKISQPYFTDGFEIKKGIIETKDYRIVVRPANYVSSTRPAVVPIYPFLKEREEMFFASPYYYYNDDSLTGEEKIVFRNSLSFYVDIVIDPKSHSLEVNPGKGVLLELNGDFHSGIIFGPVNYREDMVTSAGSSVWALCDYKTTNSYVRRAPEDDVPKEKHRLTKPQTLKKGGKYCFVIRYDIPPLDPETSFFKLHLNGLNLGELKVLEFKPESLLQ